MKRPLRTGDCCSCTYNKVIAAESRSRRLGLVVNLGAGTNGQTQSAYPRYPEKLKFTAVPHWVIRDLSRTSEDFGVSYSALHPLIFGFLVYHSLFDFFHPIIYR